MNTNPYLGNNFTTYNCTRNLQLNVRVTSYGSIPLNELQRNKSHAGFSLAYSNNAGPGL
jgi:hypothetical protein